MRIGLIILFLGIQWMTSAQNLQFERLQMKDGLSSNYNWSSQSVLVDRFGFIWFSTVDGLNRWDGYEVEVFRNNVFDSTSIGSNFITALVEDEDGLIWIATANKGVHYYDYNTQQFTQLAAGTDSDLLTTQVNTLQYYDGKLWIGTHLQGIWFYDKEKDILKVHPFFKEEGIELKYASFNNSLLLKNGSFVFSGYEGFYFYDSSKDRFDIINGEALTSTCLAEDSKGRIIFGSKFQKGLSILDPSSKKVKPFPTKFKGHVYCVRTGLDSSLWIGYVNKLCKYDFGKDSTICSFYNVYSPNSHPESSAIEIDFDQLGNLWYMTSGGGGGFVDLKGKLFELVFRYRVNEFQFVDETKGLANVMDKGLQSFEIKDGYQYSNFDSNRIQGPLVALQANNGDLYFNRFKSTEQKWIRQTKNGEEVLKNVPNLGIDQMVEDANGKIWTDNALMNFNPITNQIEYPNMSLEANNSKILLPKLEGSCVEILADQTVLLGTTKLGFYHYDPIGKSANHYSSKNFKIGNFSGEGISDFYESPSTGKVYIATYEDINVWDRNTDTFNYIGQDKVRGRTVAMLEDDDGYLWVHSALGIYKLKGDSVIAHFGSNYNLDMEVDLLRNFMKQGPDGLIYFNSSKGFFKFNPEDFKNLKPPQDVIIDELYMARTLLKPETNGLIEHSILSKGKLNFKYKHRDIGFGFVSINGKLNNTKYYYRLKGYQEDWVEAEGRTVHFTNLDNGRYTFEVKAKDSNGNWTQNVSSQNFSILAPWYEKWYAYLLYALALFGVTYIIYYIRLRRLLKYQNLRIQISSDLHDDVGTLLSSVAMQSEILALDAPKEKIDRFDKLSDLSREAMGRMRDTVWAIDSRKDKMIHLVDRMEDFLADTLQGSALEYDFKKEFTKAASIPPDIRQNVYLIFKEAVTNAKKYSNGDLVKLQLIQNKSSIHLSVKDNGRVDAENIKTSGTGLSNFKLRAQRIKGQIQIEHEGGFGIHLQCDW